MHAAHFNTNSAENGDLFLWNGCRIRRTQQSGCMEFALVSMSMLLGQYLSTEQRRKLQCIYSTCGPIHSLAFLFGDSIQDFPHHSLPLDLCMCVFHFAHIFALRVFFNDHSDAYFCSTKQQPLGTLSDSPPLSHTLLTFLQPVVHSL